MTTPRIPQSLVLAIYPTSRGYAFVLFEGAQVLFDWGVKDIRRRNKNDETMRNIRALVERYRPDQIVIEDYGEPGSRRSSRIRRLYRMITHLAESQFIDVSRIRRESVLASFAAVGARRKYEVAQAIAEQFPEIAHRLPRFRKIWMSEDPRQSLFDAAAIGVTYFADMSKYSRSCM